MTRSTMYELQIVSAQSYLLEQHLAALGAVFLEDVHRDRFERLVRTQDYTLMKAILSIIRLNVVMWKSSIHSGALVSVLHRRI